MQARVELKQWCIHPGFKTYRQSQLKSKQRVPVEHKNGDLSPQKKFTCKKYKIMIIKIH